MSETSFSTISSDISPDILWTSVCKVHFGKDHKDLYIEEAKLVNIRDASAILLVFEHLKADTTPIVSDDTAILLLKVGFVNNDGTWSLDADRALQLHKIKDMAREQFHNDWSILRYDKFEEKIESLLKEYNSHLADVESGSFQETTEMANSQRKAVREFMPTCHHRSLLGTLYKLLVKQQENQEHCVVWHLEDSLLVERGDECSQSFVELLLAHLRFRPGGDASTRNYTVDPYLSDKRIRQLLHCFPSHVQNEKHVVQVGHFGTNESCLRLNCDGSADAKCDEDFTIMSWCDIL